MKRSRLAATALAAAATLSFAAPAEATFPGEVNGRLAWAGVHDGQRGIFTSKPDGSDVQQLLAGTVGEPSWAPHGEQIAFTTYGQIGLVGADGSGWTMLTDRSEVSVAFNPSWSPDGTKIVFTGAQWGSYYYGSSQDIYVVDVDGTHVQKITDTPHDYESTPKWSPDGTRIAFSRPTYTGPPYYGYSQDIYTVKPDGSDLRNVTNGGYNMWPDWSPDSSRLVFSRSNWGGEGVISTIARDGSDYQDLVYTGMAPIYSPDGKQIAYTRGLPYPALTSALAVLPAGGGALSMITSADDVANEASWQALQTWPDYSSPKPEVPKPEVPVDEVPVIDVPPVVPAAQEPPVPPAPPTGLAAQMRTFVASAMGRAAGKARSAGLAGLGKGFVLRSPLPAPGHLQVDVLAASGSARAAAARPRLLARGRSAGSTAVKVKVRPTKAGRRAARKGRKLRVIVRVSYMPNDVPAATSQTRVTLKRRR